MAVQKNIDPGSVFDHFGGRPGGAARVDSQMGECDHIIGSLVAGGISGFLHTFIKSGSVLILLETVNEFPVFILKIFRCGGSDRLRRADSDECNSLSVGLHHLVRFKNGFPGSQILKVTG